MAASDPKRKAAGLGESSYRETKFEVEMITKPTTSFIAEILAGISGFSVIALLTASLAYSQESDRPIVTESAIGISPDQADWVPCPKGSPEGCEIAVLFGDMESGSSHILYRIPPGSPPFSMFWHTSSEHGVMIQGSLTGSGDDGEEFTMSEGMYWFIPAGLIHGGVRCSGDQTCIWYEYFEDPWDSNVVAKAIGDGEVE